MIYQFIYLDIPKLKLDFFMYDIYKFLSLQQAEVFGKNKKVPSAVAYQEKNWLKIAVIEKQVWSKLWKLKAFP